jgi:mRNA interferase MazF
LHRRGDVVALPAPRGGIGNEQRGKRYAVVLQSDELAHLSTLIVAPTSTAAPPRAFRPEIEVQGRRTRLLVEQLRAVDPARLGRTVGHLSALELRATDEALKDLLGLF